MSRKMRFLIASFFIFFMAFGFFSACKQDTEEARPVDEKFEFSESIYYCIKDQKFDLKLKGSSPSYTFTGGDVDYKVIPIYPPKTEYDNVKIGSLSPNTATGSFYFTSFNPGVCKVWVQLTDRFGNQIEKAECTVIVLGVSVCESSYSFSYRGDIKCLYCGPIEISLKKDEVYSQAVSAEFLPNGEGEYSKYCYVDSIKYTLSGDSLVLCDENGQSLENNFVVSATEMSTKQIYVKVAKENPDSNFLTLTISPIYKADIDPKAKLESAKVIVSFRFTSN